MVGGLRNSNNFLHSEDYISGAVMRSAFADDILLSNPNYKVNSISNSGKYNYVEYDEKLCSELSEAQKEVYKKFSDMYFSYFYPEDSIPAPLTTKVCKTCGTEHSLKDIVFNMGNLTCKDCEKYLKNTHLDDDKTNKIPKRMENLKGLIHLQGNKYVSTKVERSLSTHTSICYTTHTALNGSLYSIDAIKKGTIFTGYIDDCDTGLIELGKIVYAGKYSSNGFGKLQIVEISDVLNEDLTSRVERFNNIFHEDANREYISILLLSDAKLLSTDTADGSNILSTKEYNLLWKEAIFKDCNIFNVEKIFAQNTFYSGFDTSMGYNEWRKEPEILTLKGTSFKVSYDRKDKSKALEVLKTLETNGIGNDTNNGYGQIAICHKIHCLGDNSNG